ncbi:hypothetical protein [Paraburkholderia fungorum]|uniref:Uncharacterized protein n=1 Tax=Paraburkholderia fungorum TaxID=134537 RepID=A0A420FT36_9BURK|nr:hypothetical protein [Paraburkholderia fungorum]RKF36129.1 hypothetical protein BCY88_36655 [Paraburkholderia fungorum]
MNELDIIYYAARAANLETRRYHAAVHVRPRHDTTAPWRPFNPLKHDSDSHKLAAAARVDVNHHNEYVAAMAGVGAMRIFTHEDINVDKLPDLDCAERRRAMRRAVTECAALIGRDFGPFWWRKTPLLRRDA